MTLLKELFEDVNKQPADIFDVIKSYPTKYGKAIGQLWDTRLTFQGKKWEDVYSSASAMAEDFVKNSEGFFHQEFLMAGKVENEEVERYVDIELEVDSAQEVYCGVDLNDPNSLYIGFDIWMNDEAVWEDFYKAFKKEFGVTFDSDNEEHEAVSDEFWKEIQKGQSFSALIKVSMSNGKYRKAVVEIDSNDLRRGGIFYKAIFNSPEFKALGLKNVRLD